jgi:integrase
MSKRATGHVTHNANGFTARVRIAPGPKGRSSFALSSRTQEDADARAALLADMARRLRPVAAVEGIAELLTVAAKARTDKQLQTAKDAVDEMVSGIAERASSALSATFEDFADEWTSGKLHKKHPDHVREKDSKRDSDILRLHINPVIGTKRIADVALDDCERVMGAIPSDLAPATRRHIAQCMRKVLSFAVYPGRHIAANPIPREWMPKVPKSTSKAKSCLYPQEDAKLLQCTGIPIERRLVYGILDREGMRASELELLRWRDLDLDRGRVRLDENKTSDPRAWALSPDVARALVWWKRETGREADDLVIGLDLGDGAWWLRGDDGWTEGDPTKRKGDLRTAGVTRAELFERSKSRQPVRLHDLRATFVTVSLANGKTEQWVTDRTGHKSSQMLALYSRQARTWSELELGELEPLDVLLPEVPRAAAHWPAIGQQIVGRAGFEPATYGLKVRSSTD